MRAPAIRRSIAALATLVVVVAGCAQAPERRGGRVPVTVATAETRSVPYELDATGTVEPIASADVLPQVGGMVTRIAFREGDDVRAGQVLVELDKTVFETEFARTAALLERDRAQARTAQRNWERTQALARQQLVSNGEVDDARSAAESAIATAVADSASHARAALDLAHATVRAPISGRTGKLNVHVGDVVRANEAASSVVTINQLRPIRVRFTIPQGDMSELQGEQRRDVSVYVVHDDTDSASAEGALAFVDNQVDAASGTLLLKGEFPNQDASLWPGAFVRVRLKLHEQQGATVVPTAAVNNSQSGSYIYVVKSDTTVEMRPVNVMRSWQDLSVVASGIQPGETVVTDGQVRLSPGAKALIRMPGGAGGGEQRAGGETGNGKQAGAPGKPGANGANRQAAAGGAHTGGGSAPVSSETQR
ncbi:MAG TPA: efflux RND transporter periplasmic adaptor subunit [Verrucomicrobiae bacterium]|jgi:multidrug efflux system membrane fusion protein|nr:efflux RND transporter periplasmic adaptor subunit [Verrucomicrobiae bacterium]